MKKISILLITAVMLSLCAVSVYAEDCDHVAGSPERVNEVPATCAAEGSYEEIISCVKCGEVLSDTPGKVIPKNSNHSFGAWTVTEKATCGAAGSQSRTCSVCGTTETEEIPATGNHSFGAWTVTREASCTQEGEKTRKCSVCGETETESIEKTEHIFANPTVTKEATCTENGEETGTCTVCGEKQVNEIPALGHDFGDGEVVKEATCAENGISRKTCSRCGETEDEELSLADHTYGEWTTVVEATCTEAGSEERICSVCGAIETREVVISHEYTDFEIVTAATIYSTGLGYPKCIHCGEVLEEETVIPCSYYDETYGINFAAEEGVFPVGSKISVQEITESDIEYEDAEYAMETLSGKYVFYDIYVMCDSQFVEPEGKVSVTFTVPEGLSGSLSLYCIEDGEVIETIPVTMSEDGKTSKRNLPTSVSMPLRKMKPKSKMRSRTR